MDEQTLTMVFTLDNGDNYNINVDFPKDNLNKATVDAVMQKFKKPLTKPTSCWDEQGGGEVVEARNK